MSTDDKARMLVEWLAAFAEKYPNLLAGDAALAAREWLEEHGGEVT